MSIHAAENLFANLPSKLSQELIDVLAESKNVRLERIVSTGQCSPNGFWYDQDEHEWVTVLKGTATLEFDDGQSVELKPGDYLFIPAHKKHRVASTTLVEATVWLALFFRGE